MKRLIIFVLLMFSFASLMTGTMANDNKWAIRTAPDGFMWKPFETETGTIGAKNAKGEVIVPAFYTKIEYYDGSFIAKDRCGIVSIYTNNGELILPAYDVSEVNYNKDINHSPYVLFSKKSTYRAMDREGKITIPEDNYSFVKIVGEQDDWTYWLAKDGTQAIADQNGNLLIPFNKYNFIQRSGNKTEGITYSFIIYDDSIKSGVCDEKGKELFRNYSRFSYRKKDEKGDFCYYSNIGNTTIRVDAHGNPLSKTSNISDGLYPIKLNGVSFTAKLLTNGKIGVCQGTNCIIPAEFDDIYCMDHYFQVKKGCYQGVYDINGSCVIPPNKYTAIAEMSNGYFYAIYKDCQTAVSLNGKEYAPLEYPSCVLLVHKKDTIMYKVNRENMKCALFNNKNEQLTPFQYDEASLVTDIKTDKNYLFVNERGRIGVCQLDGTEIISPIYTEIGFVGDENNRYFFVVNGRMKGVYGLDGSLIISPEMFDNIEYSNKKFIATGHDRKCVFNNKGKLLSDSHPETERDQFIDLADQEFDKEHWKKAANYYGKALEYSETATLYFNRGVSYYNNKQYNQAIKDFTQCLRKDPSQNLIDRSRALIAKARELQALKEESRQMIVANIFGMALGVASAFVPRPVAHQVSTPASFHRDTSMDYLLDPNYAMQQVQMQNWREYMSMTNGGRTMSYEEWFSLKAQAMAGSQQYSSGGASSTSSGTSSNSNSISSGKMCRLCAGTGSCKTCDGKGFYYSSFDLSKAIPCPNCMNHNGKCSSCGGSGVNL